MKDNTVTGFQCWQAVISAVIQHQNVCWTISHEGCTSWCEFDSVAVLFTGSMNFPWSLNGHEVHVVTLKLPESFTFPEIAFPTTQCMNTAPHLHIVLVIKRYLGGILCVRAQSNLHQVIFDHMWTPKTLTETQVWHVQVGKHLTSYTFSRDRATLASDLRKV